MRNHKARLDRLEKGLPPADADPGERGARIYLRALSGAALTPHEEEELGVFMAEVRQLLTRDYGPNWDRDTFEDLPLLEVEPAPPDEVQP